jgi:tetratricopeptide (TPR) repeat protein
MLMKNVGTARSLLLVALFSLALISCLKEPSRDNASALAPLETNRNTGAFQVLPTDTFFTITPRVGKLMHKYGLNILKMFQHPEDRSGVKALESVIKRQEVRADTELYVALNVYLGLLYSTRGEDDNALNAFRLAEEAAITDKANYRRTLSFIYSSAAIIAAHIKNYSEAIRMRKILIEEYQGIGSGMRKNEEAARSVEQLAFLMQFGQGLPPAEAENIKKYLIELTKKYHGSEVGLAAVASLYDISKRANDEQRAAEYLKQMQAYPSTPEFRQYSEPILRQWERIEATKRKAEQ